MSSIRDFNIGNLITKSVVVAQYIKLSIFDAIDYYKQVLVFHLPIYLYTNDFIIFDQTQSIKRFDQDSDDDSTASDSDSDCSKTITYCAFITELIFVYTPHNSAKRIHRRMHGAQLRPFIDDKGRFFIGHLERHFPTLDTIVLRYNKYPLSGYEAPTDNSNVKSFYDSYITKIIDVKRRIDIKSNEGYKMGVYM